jgi:hypothetical protein
MKLKPHQGMVKSFEKNRSFFERRSVRERVDWSKALHGEICFLAINSAITCYAAERSDLAVAWIGDAHYLIDESNKRTRGHSELDAIDLTRVDVAIAEKTEKLLRSETIDRTPATPYEAFEAYLSSASEIQLEDHDCVWLVWGLCALLEGQDARYEELMTKVRRKPHRELVQERELLKNLGALFDGSADETFWGVYHEVLQRWLDPVLETESEAFLYRDVIRYLLAMNWMVFRLRSERRDDFLEVLYGNV